MGVADWLSGLFGSSPPQGKTYSAPPLASYPSSQDAASARAAGFGYGTALEPYINQNVARVLGFPAPRVPQKPAFGQAVSAPREFISYGGSGYDLDRLAGSAGDNRMSGIADLTDPSNAALRERIGDKWARAALAANRIPLASLGMDPRRATIDAVTQKANVGGVYSPGTDTYFTIGGGDRDSLVHEPIHRGIETLRRSNSPEVNQALSRLPEEELIVRYLMATQAGDPELGRGNLGDAQRKQALGEWALNKSEYDQNLGVLDRAAQAAIARRQPMGPR